MRKSTLNGHLKIYSYLHIGSASQFWNNLSSQPIPSFRRYISRNPNCSGCSGLSLMLGTDGGSATGSDVSFASSTVSVWRLIVFALSLNKRKMPDSKETSSGLIDSPNHIRSNVPSCFCPEASPKSPFETNSMIFRRRILSGSISLVNEPFRKLCRMLARGQALPAAMKLDNYKPYD